MPRASALAAACGCGGLALRYPHQRRLARVRCAWLCVWMPTCVRARARHLCVRGTTTEPGAHRPGNLTPATTGSGIVSPNNAHHTPHNLDSTDAGSVASISSIATDGLIWVNALTVDLAALQPEATRQPRHKTALHLATVLAEGSLDGSGDDMGFRQASSARVAGAFGVCSVPACGVCCTVCVCVCVGRPCRVGVYVVGPWERNVGVSHTSSRVLVWLYAPLDTTLFYRC
jgi:hypothetical protein